MMLIIIISIIILQSNKIQCYNSNSANYDTLLSVHLIMRHAARAPALRELKNWNYPFYNDTTRWPNGYSELTDIGIKQAINAGEFIKQRYEGFIPKDPKNAILRSTNIDRNWDTSALIGKVLWPVNKNRLDSMPPRIFTLPFPLDNLYYFPYCPNLFKGPPDSPELREINTKYQFVYDIVANHTGYANTLRSVESFSEYLYQNNFNGYAPPDWVTDYYYNLIKTLGLKYLNLWISGLTVKLYIGKFLEELKNRMESVIKPDCDADAWYKNFFIYVAHGFEVYSTLKSMGHVPTDYVHYASMVIFELHQINEELKVKVFHINETILPPFRGYQMKLPFCPEYDCPYETFISGIKRYIPNNWRDDCGIPKDLDIYSILEKWQTITNENINP